jgi:hypothetical protein
VRILASASERSALTAEREVRCRLEHLIRNASYVLDETLPMQPTLIHIVRLATAAAECAPAGT